MLSIVIMANIPMALIGSVAAIWLSDQTLSVASLVGFITLIFVAVDGRVAGIIAIADPIKATTADAVRGLKAESIRVVMLTGDNRRTAEAVARRLGIEEVEAEVLPDQKSAVVERLKRQGRTVAMAGDGVNDAPALAAADIGIAMGWGTDVAIESAGVTLIKGDLTGIVRARRLSEATMRNIRQNLFFAFVYNSSGVPIAAGRRDLFTEISFVFMDTTSLCFEGAGGEALGQHGNSKDHRPDLKQMILGVVIDGEGRPICTEMVPGNTADVTVLMPIVDRLPCFIPFSASCSRRCLPWLPWRSRRSASSAIP